MQDPPPRRSRRPPSRETGSSFPLIPIVLGVIVIGFVIGAGLSMAGKRGDDRVAVATASPTVQPTLAPATLAPTEKPTLEPTLEPTEKPTLAPTEKPTREPTSEATRAPATHAPATHPAAAQVPAAIAPSATPVAVAPSAAATRVRTRPVTVAAAPSPSVPTDAPPSTDDADSEFARQAAGVVRGYVAAVARGDDAAAAATLADSGDTVTETGTIDGSTRIKHVEARGAGQAATVNVDFGSPNGTFFGQYTVRRSATGAAVIVSHTIVKP